MNRRNAAILIGTVFLLALVALLIRRGGDGEADAGGEGPAAKAPPAGAVVPVELYFPDGFGTLTLEEREVAATADSETRLTVILDALLAGPVDESLYAPLEPPVEAGGIHISADGVAYVDLTSAEHSVPTTTGTRGELLAVYSLVNSLLLNTPEIDAVVLLWNGQQLESFAGHIDTTQPLRPNPALHRAR